MRETHVDLQSQGNYTLFRFRETVRSTDVVGPISLASPTDSEYLRSGIWYMIHNEVSMVVMLGKAPAKDDTCHHCIEVGQCKRNCPAYLAELIKKKKQVGTASSSDVFIIELFSFPTKSWVYDTSCGTIICNTKQGFRIEKKLKRGSLYLYVGNGVRAQVEAIRSFDLVLPNGLVICLDNCHYAPTITRGVVSVSRLVDNGFVQCFTDYEFQFQREWELEGFEPHQEIEVIPIRRLEEHKSRDLMESAAIRAAMLDSESNKWIVRYECGNTIHDWTIMVGSWSILLLWVHSCMRLGCLQTTSDVAFRKKYGQAISTESARIRVNAIAMLDSRLIEMTLSLRQICFRFGLMDRRSVIEEFQAKLPCNSAFLMLMKPGSSGKRQTLSRRFNYVRECVELGENKDT
ncbi:hypothetical protein Tco_0355408 [Tanacetum coccineum]